jgi:hypothetical protein
MPLSSFVFRKNQRSEGHALLAGVEEYLPGAHTSQHICIEFGI